MLPINTSIVCPNRAILMATLHGISLILSIPLHYHYYHIISYHIILHAWLFIAIWWSLIVLVAMFWRCYNGTDVLKVMALNMVHCVHVLRYTVMNYYTEWAISLIYYILHTSIHHIIIISQSTHVSWKIIMISWYDYMMIWYRYVPWITINSFPIEDPSQLLRMICKLHMGVRPAGCSLRLRASTPSGTSPRSDGEYNQ